jgi:diguanylate cyclase (GGDEF)-like protein
MDIRCSEELRAHPQLLRPSWALIRLGVAGWTLFQFTAYQPSDGVQVPFPQVPVGLAFAAVIAASGVLLLRAQSDADPETLRRVTGWLPLADLALVLSLLWLFVFDPATELWALLLLPVTESAMVRGLAAAVATWAAAAGGYLLVTLRAGKAHGLLLPVSSTTFRLGLVLLAALLAGTSANALADELAQVRRSRRALAHLATHDALTGLTNRVVFLDRLEHAIRRARRSRRLVGVLYLDVDDFKAVNDRAGHAGGDRFLQHLANRIRVSVRPGDTVARVGGDEFAVLLDELDSPAEATVVVERLLDRVGHPLSVAGEPVRPSVSVGVAVADGHTADQLLEDADAAMYRAKGAGKNRWHLVS